MGGRIGPEIETCESSGQPIPMVPHLHKSNGYMKRKLRVWRAQKFIALVGAEIVLASVGSQTTPFHVGSIGPVIEIFETSGLPIPMVPCLHQSNDYIKRNLRVWRAQKCIALFSAETVLTSVGPQTTPFYGGQYRAKNGNIRNFGPTNPHGSVFVQKQWLYQKEATGMERSKMYCSSRCRNSTYQGGSTNYPV